MKESILAKDVKLAPSELFVNDLTKMTDFYADTAGFEILDKTTNHTILGFDKNPIIKLTKKPNLKFAHMPSAGLFHNAVVYGSRSQLAKAVKNILVRAPHLYEGTGDHLVSEAFYFHDPEGNGLELYFDRPRKDWQWHNGRIAMDTLYIDPENYITQYLKNGVVDEKHLGHVHLRVGDIPAARKFYVDILGFDITFDMPSALFLSVGGYHHHIGANTWMSQGASKRTPALGLAEFDIHLPESSDLANLSDRLQKFEYKYQDKNQKIEVDDPWGNKILFLAP